VFQQTRERDDTRVHTHTNIHEYTHRGVMMGRAGTPIDRKDGSYTHTYIHIHTGIQTRIYTRTHTQEQRWEEQVFQLTREIDDTYTLTHTHTYIHTRTHTHMHMHRGATMGRAGVSTDKRDG